MRGYIVKKKNKNKTVKLAYRIFLVSFILSLLMSFVSGTVMTASSLYFKLFILLFIVFTGIIFDMVGVAVAVCDPAPFHAMASKKNKVAKIAIKLVNKASLVATFSNDVVGDIAGIISGAAIGSIVSDIILIHTGFEEIVFSTFLSALVAGLTVGGKAVGKVYAIERSKEIIFTVSKIIYFLKCFFTFKWIRGKRGGV